MINNVEKLLKYIQRTNPEMTYEKMIEELKKNSYTTKGLLISANKFLK